jgi:pimeloyl-ACP methyl ester carboxylesterase
MPYGNDAKAVADGLGSFAAIQANGVAERVAMLPWASGSLFSVLLEPGERIARSIGLVICHSFFELKMLQTIEFRLLRRAAGAGFAGIYVQAPGMGDSLGDPGGCFIADRVDAVLAAGDALLSGTPGVERLCFVGARLGAAVALMAAARHPRTAGVVLWDPALDGDEYWTQMRRYERVVGALRRRRTEDPDLELEREGRTGTIGYTVSQAQRDDLSLIREVSSQPQLDVSALLVCLNDASLVGARRSVEPLVAELETECLTRLRPRHLIHLRFSDAQGAVHPTVEWLDRRFA